MSDFHLTKLTPHTRQIIHLAVIHFSSLVKYNSRLSQLTMLLIELSKLHPQGVGFAGC